MKIEHLLEEFNHRAVFTTKDVRDFYFKNDKEMPNSTINWRIYQLVQSGIISRVGRGKFIVGSSSDFKPRIGRKESSIAKQIKKQFPFIEFCIWKTDVIREFSLHQSFINFIVVEIERDSMEAVYHFLKEKHKKVYLKPDKNIIENYLLELKNIIVVQNLISEAPLQKLSKIPTVTVEKILVDLICGKALFYYYQGYELHNIFQRAFEKYTINESKLLRYADRRKKKAEVLKLIKAINRH
ncbi:MAG TPA: hypothetical protein ENI82_00640 [Bacteroidetes bacterium]|nr:hypothetical protein [Bacteroidota bacterium]